MILLMCFTMSILTSFLIMTESLGFFGVSKGFLKRFRLKEPQKGLLGSNWFPMLKSIGILEREKVSRPMVGS